MVSIAYAALAPFSSGLAALASFVGLMTLLRAVGRGAVYVRSLYKIRQ
ncbi:MAG: hypothetical protein ACP5I3_06770 [Thermoproteus sp.]